MQYLLMIYQNEADYAKMDQATSQKMLAEYGAFTQSIIQGGNFKVRNAASAPPETAWWPDIRRGRGRGPARRARPRDGGDVLDGGVSTLPSSTP